MAENTDADETQNIEVTDRGETLTVPTQFERGDLAAWYADVPDEIRVDRIFRYDAVVRAEMRIEDGEWVEVGYFRDDDHKPGVDTGWVAQRLENTGDVSPHTEGPGETIWTR